MRGLILYVYSCPGYEGCSNGGISSRAREVVLVGEGIDEIFEATPERPAVRLVRRDMGGEVVVHAEPFERCPKGRVGYMAGGAYVASTDSRFGAALRRLGHAGYCAISLHDRSETPEDYRWNSI